MYQAAIHALLGLRRNRGTMSLNPCIPTVWPQYSVEWTIGTTRYRITVSNPEHRSRGIASAELDGVAVDPQTIPLEDDGGRHEVTIVLGAAPADGMRIAAAGPGEHRRS
jgi:cyclic beta-1,2-glucan synthetase